MKEGIKETNKEETKPKAKAKPRAKAKPKQVIITKEPVVEPIVEPVEEPTAPVKINRLKQIVKCLDCNMDMTQHTLKYIHKRRGFCKADIKAAPEQPVPEPVVQQKPKITEDIVNDYIKQNHEIVSTYLRHERSMKAQRKQMHVRSLLNNAF